MSIPTRRPLLDPAFQSNPRKRPKPNTAIPSRVATGGTSLVEEWSATSGDRPTTQIIHHLADYDTPRIRRALRGSFRPGARGGVHSLLSAAHSRPQPRPIPVDNTQFEEASIEHSGFHIDQPLPRQRKRKTQTSHLTDWMVQRSTFLYEMTEREAPPPTMRCSQPFHRVAKWNGDAFIPSSLRFTGLTLNLGHGGGLCPQYAASIPLPPDDILPRPTFGPPAAEDAAPGPSAFPDINPLHISPPNGVEDEDENTLSALADPNNAEDSDDEQANHDSGGLLAHSQRYPKGLDSLGHQWVTIVDITGIHHLPTRVCTCNPITDTFVQFLRLGLFPVTHERPQTVFTFRVLEDYDLNNLQTKSSAQGYYSKLKRLTDDCFPHLVPDRYRELMRVAREWRNLKARQNAGVAHDANVKVTGGGLALFCPACPQPGINLPDDWQADSEKWKFMRTLIGDGNFKQEHLKMKYPEDDVPLSDGHGYFVGKRDFDEYIANAPHPKAHKSTCHEHDAVKSQNATRAHLDATGIGAIACARHGCFYPHSVINFEKGEGYRYMDYAFVNAINYIPFLLLLLMLYDIMCQYWVHFLERIDLCFPYLTLSNTLTIRRGIGLFHVHGHVKECYPRYAPTFIRGAGQVDGEVIETLWATLNHTASSSRTMSWFHRQEYLDAHMADSNWRKLVRMVPSIMRKWKACLDQVEDSEEYFQQLCRRVGPELTAQYTLEEEQLQHERLSNVSVMDSVDVKDGAAPGKADVQLTLAASELQSDISPGSAAWISLGLKLEEQQIELMKHVRSLGTKPTVEQQLSLQERRRRLQARLDAFTRRGSEYLGELVTLPSNTLDDEWFDVNDDDDMAIPSTMNASDVPVVVETTFPEQQSLPLPSSYGKEKCSGPLHRIASCELQLREGQANDALHLLRVAIAHKSFIYRSRIRNNAPTTNYAKRLRSYGDAHAIQMSIDNAAKIYTTARKAMVMLGACDDLLDQFQLLKREDLTASTAVANSNEAGQGKQKLSWIWHTTSRTGTDDPVFVTEMFRVNWLRAKSRRDRWAEEKVLLQSELTWTHRFFTHRAEQWTKRSMHTTPGHSCHASRQANTWRNFAREANRALRVVNGP
ncbi:hypothetical protein QCA50_018678 [Cerrena zonata]|uniref:CxC2-like cysteine cluster KDZ transposase-associated domain-containing protein n=1 Tax=Cerrena zonata TaxID=2478898 RepID=A0AAW0FAL3_9APHY